MLSTSTETFRQLASDLTKSLAPISGALDLQQLQSVYAACDRWLSNHLAAFDQAYLLKQALPMITTHLGAGQPDRVVSASAWTALRSPHTGNRQAALHLLEMTALCSPKNGGGKSGMSPDRLRSLMSASKLTWFVSNVLSCIHGEIGSLDDFNVESTSVTITASVDVDVDGYQKANSAHADSQPDAASESVVLNWLVGRSVKAPGRWGEIDSAYAEENNFSLRDLFTALGSVATLRTPPQHTSVLALSKQISRRGGIEPVRALAAITGLTFVPDAELVAPYKQRERVGRLALQPLVSKTSSSVWIVPKLAENAILIYGTYFDRALTPWPEVKGKNPRSDVLIKDEEADRNRAFELQISDGLSAIGYVAVCNVKSRDGLRISGDIDVLAARPTPSGGEIPVIEAKDPIQAYSPGQMNSQLKNFRGWVRKHDERVSIVRSPAGAAAVEKLLGVPLEAPVVIDRIITRMPAVASFTSELQSRVTAYDRFLAELR